MIAKQTGIAYVHPADQFVKEVGRKLALRRALGTLNKPMRAAVWQAYLNRGTPRTAIKGREKKIVVYDDAQFSYTVAQPREIDIVFDGPPGPEAGRFVEVEETLTGRSVAIGEWVNRDDGYWVLRLMAVSDTQRTVNARPVDQSDMVCSTCHDDPFGHPADAQ